MPAASVTPAPRIVAAVILCLVAALTPARSDGPAETPETGVADGVTPEVSVETFADLVRRGSDDRQQGRWREAIGAYRRARDLEPERYEVRILLADSLRRTGHGSEARGEYQAAVPLAPDRAEAYVGLALLRRAAYDLEGAAQIVNGALPRVRLDDRSDLLLTLAETRRRQGRLGEAEEMFARVVAQRRDDPEAAPAHAGIGRLQESRGDLDAAIAAWDRYLDRRPDDDAVRLHREELAELRRAIGALRGVGGTEPDRATLAELGRLYRLAGDHRAAVAALRRAGEMRGDDPPARRALALALHDAGDDDGSVAEFRRLLARRPGDPLALYHLAASAARMRDAGAEEEAWITLLVAHPDDGYALQAFLAFAGRMRGQGTAVLARQIDRLRANIDPTPHRVTAILAQLAMLLGRAGRDGEAAAALWQALLRDPTDPRTLEIAGRLFQERPQTSTILRQRILQESGRPDPQDVARSLLVYRLMQWNGRAGEALILARRLAGRHPGSSMARSAVTEAHQLAGGDPAAALSEAQAAVHLDPDRLTAQVDLALGLLHAGRPEEAEAAARSALIHIPGAAPILSTLAAALADQGSYEAAAVTYESALEVDPADNFGLARSQYPLVLAAMGRSIEARAALVGDLPLFPGMLYAEALGFTAGAALRGAGIDWAAWHDRHQGRLSTPAEAWQAIAEMLESLDDPHTRLRDPEETGSVYLTRHGAVVAMDRFGRNRSHSRTVTMENLPGELGYIRISNLTDPRVIDEVRQALETMREKDGIVLDLRGNSGGLVRNADAIGDLITGPGREAGIDVGPSGETRQITGGDGAIIEGRVVVLVDGQTASAAERLARTLEAAGRGVLIGDATYGKGRAQMTRILPGGYTVMVSAGEMLAPDGRPIQGRGLEPQTPGAPGEKAIDRARTILEESADPDAAPSPTPTPASSPAPSPR